MGKSNKKTNSNSQTPNTQQETPTTSKKSQEEIINELTSRILQLENKVEILESTIQVTQRVNTALSNEIDDLQQYQRRQCIIIDGIQTTPNETVEEVSQKAEKVLIKKLNLDEEEVECEIDKCHRVGPVKEDGTQSTIIRLRSHAFREKVYVKRKKLKDTRYKIKLSLTKRRRQTLAYTYQIAAKVPQVAFFYSDIHGNLKLRLNDPINNKYVYGFRDKNDLLSLFHEFGWNTDLGEDQPRED